MFFSWYSFLCLTNKNKRKVEFFARTMTNLLEAKVHNMNPWSDRKGFSIVPKIASFFFSPVFIPALTHLLYFSRSTIFSFSSAACIVFMTSSKHATLIKRLDKKEVTARGLRRKRWLAPGPGQGFDICFASFCTSEQVPRWSERRPFVISASGSLDLLGLNKVRWPGWIQKGQSKDAAAPSATTRFHWHEPSLSTESSKGEKPSAC